MLDRMNPPGASFRRSPRSLSESTFVFLLLAVELIKVDTLLSAFTFVIIEVPA